MKFQSLWIGGIYFLILLIVALSIRDIPQQPDATNATLYNMYKTLKIQDPSSFATAAIDVYETGWIRPENRWIFNLWPPGFIILEAFLVKLLGADAPIILILQICTALLFSVAFLCFYDFLSKFVPKKFSFFLPFVIIVFPTFRFFLLQPIGVILGESFSIGFFLLAIFMAFRSVECRLMRFAVISGIFIALSAYFRSQFEIVVIALTIFGGGIWVGLRILKNRMDPCVTKFVLKTIGVILVIVHIAMFPWRVYNWADQGSLGWVQTSVLTARNSVLTSEHLLSVGGEFVVKGAGNLTCRIDGATCGNTENARELFINTFLNYPLKWYSLKFEAIGEFWFSSLNTWLEDNPQTTYFSDLSDWFFLVALVVLFVLLFSRKVKSNEVWLVLVWFNLSLFSAYVLIFSLAHFEYRYFYFPKLLIVIMTIVLAALRFGEMAGVNEPVLEKNRKAHEYGSSGY